MIQKLNALIRGKATSSAPIMRGTKKLPKPPTIVATAPAIIMMPCRLMVVLKSLVLMNTFSESANSTLKTIARAPDSSRNTTKVVKYWRPITLWSVL